MNNEQTPINSNHDNLLSFKIGSQICPFCGDTILKKTCNWLPCGLHKCHTSCLERLQNTLETPFCLECSLSSGMDIMSKMFHSAVVSFLYLEFLYINDDGPITRTIYLQSLRTYLLFLNLYHHGVSRCAYFLGIIKQYSKYPNKNINEVIKWFKISVEQDNHRKSQLLLGKLYLKNNMILEGRHYLEKAASQNEPEAQFHLGMIERNNPISLKLIEDSLQNINQNNLKLIEPTFKGQIIWETLAEHELGLYYKNGLCVPKDIKLARDFLLKGAQKGYINSQRELGYIYMNDDTYRNFIEAIRWFKKAGNQGDSKSVLNLAIIYFKGEHGIKKNLKLSTKFFHLAKNLGESIAESYLGDLYTFDLEPALLNVELGIKFFKRSAESGEKIAQYTLASYYHLGTYQDILPKDISLAIHWYRKAAEQNSGLSQYHLGRLLGEKGIHQNRQEALEWLRKASLNGFSKANAYMLKL